MKPYINLEVTENYIIRKFDNDVDPLELLWHQDFENRTIHSIEPTDWKIQLEDELPIDINSSIFIPKNKYHRLIKGNGDLILKIYKS